LLSDSEAMPQASALPLFTAATARVALPTASSCTVAFWQTAVGATLSCTVTVAEQVAVLPLLSVAVRVTVLAPVFEQSNAVLLSDSEAMPQASALPLFTAATARVALPAASSCTVAFWQTAVGATLSCTVTVAEQVAVLPVLSVAVRVTVLA